MSLLDLLLAENVAEFNNTRGERMKVNLFAADLAQKNLRSVDLSGADVEKSDLTGTDLSESTLFKARLAGIDGSEMKLVDCMGVRARFNEAWLEDADLSGSDFSNANFTEATLIRTTGVGLRLSAAKLKLADVQEAKWPQVDLVGAKLSRANFTHAILTGADLTEAAGGEVVFTSADLSGALFSTSRLQGANFVEAKLAGARFAGADLADADFSGADLTGADFSGANLSNAVFLGATLRRCVFAEANLEGVDFTGLDLSDVDFSGLDAGLLKLSPTQLEEILTVGIVVNPDARLRPAKVVFATNKSLVAGVWENKDGEDLTTIRYTTLLDGTTQHGILPVSAKTVIAKSIVASGEGIAIVLLRDRANGVAVEIFQLDKAGVLVESSSHSLGYQPMVLPILQADGGSFRMWGIARRGPTLVISAHREEGFGPVASKQVPTVRGFLGKYQAFLSCKGNVLMPCSHAGVGSPLKCPEGFPGKFATTAFDGDTWIAVWVEPPGERVRGGVRIAELGKRGAPNVEEVTDNGAILSLDCFAFEGDTWIAYVELVGAGDTSAYLLNLNDRKPKPLPVNDVDTVTFAVGPAGEALLALTTEEESITFVDLKGKRLGVLRDE